MLLRRTVYVLLFLFVLFNKLAATHNRAGEITYKRIAPFTAVVGGLTVDVYTYSITLILYTNDGFMIQDRCNDTLYFGDNTKELIWRVNGSPGSCGCFGPQNKPVGCGEIINSEINFIVKRNIYTTIHTYPGAGTYTIHTTDPNRNAGVHNMTQSINQVFYIESLLVIDNFTGPNTSPLFSFPPIDKACVNVCYEHNPGAFDIDGDSLSYEITTSRGEGGVTVPGYFFPETGAGGSYSINPVTGLLSWCTPQLNDEYNIAFIVKEWRKNTSGDYYLVGYVLRDMQIIVGTCPINQPPQVEQIQPICVEAGKLITKQFRVFDPNAAQTVTISGGGGAFAGTSPLATLNPTTGLITNAGNLQYTSVFNWQTNCNHVRLLPYYCTIKAGDNGTTSENKLVSFMTFQIRVVPPAVTGLTASPSGSSLKLNWNPVTCNPTDNKLESYKVFRKNDCKPVSFDPCATAIPLSSDYKLIGVVSASTTNFVDNNNGVGLLVGQNYGYVVVAEYKDGLQSYAGLPMCAELSRDVPIFTNVDVTATSSTDGVIKMKWLPPLTSAGNLDTTAYKGPYKYVLSYAVNGGTYTSIFSDTKSFVRSLSTAFTHTAVNTTIGTYTYQLEFFSDTVLIGSTYKTSSIFLTASSGDRKINLNWQYNCPWKNDSFYVYRKQVGETNFRLLTKTKSTTYLDGVNVKNDSTYCYYVEAYGAYTNPLIVRPLVNHSQETCVMAKDNVPPVSPTASLISNCETALITLEWEDISAQSEDVASYQIYYKATLADSYVLIGEANANSPRIYKSDNPKQFAGCYALGATDKIGNVGPAGTEACVDICPQFVLPNVFSPNNDGINDNFQAVVVKQINEIDLAVLDRWGNVVYETKDPYFKWNGVSSISGMGCSDGTLVYVCTVYEPHIYGTTSRKLSGTLQLVR